MRQNNKTNKNIFIQKSKCKCVGKCTWKIFLMFNFKKFQIHSFSLKTDSTLENETWRMVFQTFFFDLEI